MKKIRVIIAGGGTGGHIFPGIALANQLTKSNTRSKILFVGSNSILEKKIFNDFKYDHVSISLISFRKIEMFLIFLFKSIVSIIETLQILRKFNPDIVISVGGYSAGPISLIAKIKKIPLVICEQNVLPGITNKLLFSFADRIYISFKKTIGIRKKSKVICFGNPIREEVLIKKKEKKYFSNSKEKFKIFILGGSYGASVINNALLNSLEYFKYRSSTHFIHQTGFAEKKKVTNKYHSLGLEANVKDFFNNIGKCYSLADLIICRGGATTIAEITANGIPSIIIPDPYVTGNHQELNAEVLTSLGAAVIILEKDLSAKNLAESMNLFFEKPAQLLEMGRKSASFGRKEASKLIIEDLYKIL